MATGSELPIASASALQMANLIFGDGVTVNSASYTGDSRSAGIWTNGDSVSPDLTPGDTGVILSTGRAEDITQSRGDPNRNTNTTTDTSGPNNDPGFNAAAGGSTHDAAWLDVNFTPDHNMMTIQFVFASEEYPEYANSIYNDLVGVWVNGQWVAPQPSVSVNDINGVDNSNLFRLNTNDQYNTEMDGFTVTMTLTFAVNPGVANTIRIGVADVGDAKYDSNLLIAANSIQSNLVAMDDHVEIVAGHSKVVDLLGNDVNAIGGTMTVTHINGVAVVPGQSVTLANGQVVTLNPDLTVTILATDDLGTTNFTYTIANGVGATSQAFITLKTVPCFVAGTMILTPEGERPVEELRPGDLVITLDDGPQPLRWIGRRQVPAFGPHAPVEIAAGTFGPHGTVRVSPLHRILLRDVWAELLFGSAEVLVAARDLVNGRTVRRIDGGTVDYVHILFDRHQIVIGNGLESESFLPGPQTGDAYEAEVVREIASLFPEFDPETGSGYSPAARPALKAFEGRLVGVTLPRRAGFSP